MARKILIVDDNAINRQMLINTLGNDYDIIEAENGREALELTSRQYKMLSAVLLDIVMPEMDGYEVLRHMRENALLAQIPVIMVTGSEDEESRVKALSLGANDFILKPSNPEIVKHCVRNNIALRETASILNAIQKDKLTGLFNREAFFENVTALIKEQEPGYYILSSFDIDNFKLINDQYGAPEGDRILREVGNIVKQHMDSINGVAARISADNFAALFPAREQDTSILFKIQDKMLVAPVQRPIVFSIGRYEISDVTLPASAIYDRAYLAKQSVKGRYDRHMAYFDEAMLQKLVRDQQIISEMETALAERQFEVWFQPQYNHVTGALTGAEALARWRHPLKGIVPPGEFIPLFEQNGFVYELDKYVWRESCRFLRKWLDEGFAPLPVSVNISRYDIFRADLIDVISQIVQEFDVPASLLHLEITESAFAQSTEVIVDIVKQLIALGFTIEIDDFGSGYSSLNTLKSVPAQVLKLDMRFLEEGDDVQRGGNILESIVRMAKWLDMSVIAEGVETREQSDFLKSIGCSYVQGYLYARPMPAADYEAHCRRVDRGERLLTTETVENQGHNAFGDTHCDELDSQAQRASHASYAPASDESLSIQKMLPIALAAVMDSSTDLSFVKDKDLRYICCSRAFAHMVGMESERDVVGKTDYDLFDAAFADQYVADDRKLMASGESLVDMIESIPAEDGSGKIRVSSTSKYLLYDSLGNVVGLYGTGRDITQAREAEERQRFLINSIPGGVAIYEGVWSTLDSIQLTYFSDGFCQLFGYTREEYEQLGKKNPTGLIEEAFLPGFVTQIEALVRHGTPLDYIYQARGKGNCRRWIHIKAVQGERHGNNMTVNAVLFDVTARQEMLERLRMSEEENRLAIQHSNNVVCRYDVASRTLSVSPSMDAIFELSGSVADVPYSQIRAGKISPETVDAYADFYKSIHCGQKSGELIYQRRSTQGWRWAEIRYSTIFDNDGHPASAVISFADVTDSFEKDAAYKKWLQSIQNKTPGSYSLFRCNVNKKMLFDTVDGSLLPVSFKPDSLDFDGQMAGYAEHYVLDDDAERFRSFLNIDALLEQYYHGNRTIALEYREKLLPGEYRWLRLTVDLVEYARSSDVEAYLLFEDIDEAKRAELLTMERAETDPLTGVLNRTAFAERVESLIRTASPQAQHALLMLDLDGFKQVNDAFGHDVGDQTLIDMARMLQSVLRHDDLVGRLGGDEFVLFLSNIPGQRVAANRARRICELSRKTFNPAVRISSSVGIAVCPHNGGDFDTLYKKADIMLYQVKGAGGDDFAFYQEK